jgi:hypothetical protein
VNNPIVQLVLDNLKRPDTVKEIPASVTFEEVKGKLQNWKETTSTSPISKRHLGHYQCLRTPGTFERMFLDLTMAIRDRRQ